jgi:hypothetical protein
LILQPEIVRVALPEEIGVDHDPGIHVYRMQLIFILKESITLILIMVRTYYGHKLLTTHFKVDFSLLSVRVMLERKSD